MTPLRVAAATLLAIALTAWTGLSYDLGWILDFGRQLTTDGALPRVNDRSFLAPGAAIVLHEWLSCLLLYLAHAAGGQAALVAFRWLSIVAVLAGIDASVRRETIRPAIRLVVLLAAAVALVPGVQLVRPQLFSLVLLAWVIFLDLHGARRWLPLLFVPWANLHGGWVAAVPMLLVLAALRPTGPTLERFGVPALAAVALLLNPYGPALLTHTLDHVSDPVRLLNLEWKPLWRAGRLHPFEVVGLVGFAAVIALCAAGLRRRPRHVALVVLAVGAGLAASRNLRLAPILLAPPVAAALEHLAARIPGRLVLLDRLAGPIAGAAAGLGAILLAVAGPALPKLHDYPGPNPGAVLAAMKAHGIAGDVWADVNWGGAVLWVLPDARVACDGRNVAAYPPEILRRCVGLLANGDPIGELRASGADFVLVPQAGTPGLLPDMHVVLCANGACLLALEPRPELPDPGPIGLADLF